MLSCTKGIDFNVIFYFIFMHWQQYVHATQCTLPYSQKFSLFTNSFYRCLTCQVSMGCLVSVDSESSTYIHHMEYIKRWTVLLVPLCKAWDSGRTIFFSLISTKKNLRILSNLCLFCCHSYGFYAHKMIFAKDNKIFFLQASLTRNLISETVIGMKLIINELVSVFIQSNSRAAEKWSPWNNLIC